MGLFDKPEDSHLSLSEHYNDMKYRVTHGYQASWSTLKRVHPDSCEECFWRQWESKGKTGTRRAAKVRRKWAGTVIDLCHGHAQLWKVRDEEDAKRI